MGWLEQHHTGVMRTATGVVLCAGAVTGVVANMTFQNLAADNAQKQHQIDALAHQLQQQGGTSTAPTPAGAAPTPGPVVKHTASPSPSGTPTVILLAGGSSEPVLAVPGPTTTPQAGSGGPGGTSGGSGGSGSTPGRSHAPTPRPSHPTPHPTPSPSSSPPAEPLLSSVVGVASGTLKIVTAPLHPSRPSQSPLGVLYLGLAIRRHP